MWGRHGKKSQFAMVTLAGWEKPGARALGFRTIGEDEQVPKDV